MAKRHITYIAAAIIATTATADMAAAQSIAIGTTTPAANTASVGGLSYSYSIGRITNIVISNEQAAALNQNKTRQDTNKRSKISVTAYPNPFTDYLKIKSDDPAALGQDTRIQIIDSKGSTTYEQRATGDSGEITINATFLVPGAYVIKITNGNGTCAVHAIKI